MKIYLSKYWIAGHISLVCVEVVVVVATAAFCIEYRDEENILLIICSLVLIGITYYVQSKTICILDYVEVSNNNLLSVHLAESGNVPLILMNLFIIKLCRCLKDFF